MLSQPPEPKKQDRIAQGNGICSQCQGPIRIGERFRWSGQPPVPICAACLKKHEMRDARRR